ncbi:MAG: amidohydrolase family protein, partial [Methyloversatilis sp.]|nr:amidohydrolase family protein [Methyloversatilis sp.]
MSKLRRILALAAFLLPGIAAAQTVPILFVPDRVFTATDRVMHEGWKVLVADGRIVAVG